MSNLRPKGQEIVVEGVKRYLLFTLNAIDEIQDEMDCSLEEAVNRLTDKRESAKTMKKMVSILLNDEADRKEGLKRYTPEEIGREITQENLQETLLAILRAYGLSLPEPDEYDHPNAKSGQQKK